MEKNVDGFGRRRLHALLVVLFFSSSAVFLYWIADIIAKMRFRSSADYYILGSLSIIMVNFGPPTAVLCAYLSSCLFQSICYRLIFGTIMTYLGLAYILLSTTYS